MCPLTKKTLTEPVVATDGYTYEKSAIEAYFDSGKTMSPITGEEIVDKSLIPNKTLRSLILSNSVKKLEELQQKYLETKAENIVILNSSKKASEILKTLRNTETILKQYKDGVIDIEKCLKELEGFIDLLPEDDELLQEFTLLCYWIGNYERAEKALNILSKHPLFDMVKPLFGVYAKAKTNKSEALKTFEELCKLKEDNLFRVRDVKYKAIALNGLEKNEEAMTHFNAYEVFVPFDPSVYVLFKAKTLRDIGNSKELKTLQADYFIKYGNFKELSDIK